ncbi:hypothetical protein GUITHDRAFT_111145 [Guillardia theta CCMP2712]|uniref:LysM domain-containing protein n=1 Tax=Guillardia theta (strain CCMP2712) TaxID=905079 RepID=L1J3X6_GUITC|nr:hypothetical protein GUITHDRAFT_111145 [Guillardia theta CCMP2712]EKX42775.1 hypothetical protein GUITHDRAFT_111145 [Guillardia theta CCMP2712]|eukprot:XP_005829755.1 hypothetical protein GUITHDRAFT_111145 [Guillardia theta CCMP2712]
MTCSIIFAILLALWIPMAGSYVISGSLTWERIGVVPQMLVSPQDCVQYLDVLLPSDQVSTCTRAPAKILFHVSLLVHSSFFGAGAPGGVGGEVDVSSSFKFSLGDAGATATSLKFRVVGIRDFMVGSVAHKAFQLRYDLVRLYSCSSSLPEVIASFEGVNRFSQCTTTSSQICLAPAPEAGDSLCSTAMANYSSSPFRLTTRVTFAECAGTSTGYNEYQMSPLNNHHSPVAPMLPIFTIPLVSDASRTVSLALPGFDEDGASKATNCVESCNNVDMTWDIAKVSTDGYTLSCHSDYTAGVRGQWKLSPNDVAAGGGMQLALQGPMKGQTNGSPVYPLRLKVTDRLQVYVYLELAMIVCPTISLYTFGVVNVTVDPTDQVRNLAPIFVALGPRHSPPPRLIECFVGSSCSFNVSAVAYDLSSSKVCYWDLQPGVSDSLLCDRSLQTMTGGDAVEIDTQQAALQGCKDAMQVSPGTSNCHLFVKQPTANNTALLTVSVFGSRPLAAHPVESDTGRKLAMCFQARKCPTCCYGLPHCVTIHIFGRKPRIVAPGLSPTCKLFSFFSNESFQSNVPNIDFSSDCVNLPACWKQLTRHPDNSPGRPEANGWPSQYAQGAATTNFLFTAVDDDYGDTVTMNFLEQPQYSSIFLLDPAFVSKSTSTRYLQGACYSTDLYQQNPHCSVASLFLNVTVTFGNTNGTAPMTFVQGGDRQSVLFTSDKQVCFIATDNQDLNLTIRARDPNPENVVSILSLEDPGLPDLRIDPLQCVPHINVPNNRLNNQLMDSQCSEGFRRLQWTPAEEEAGKRIRVCFVARDDSTMCSQHLNFLFSPESPLATSAGYYSLPYCIDLDVVPSSLQWLPPLAGTELGTPYFAHVGCKSSWTFTLSGGNYTSVIALSPDTQLSPQWALSALQVGVTSVSELTFGPVRGQEGSTFRVCLVGSARGYGMRGGAVRDIAGMQYSSYQCLDIKVRKCKYCTSEHETMLLQMKRFSAETNWLRLFAANAIDDNDELTTSLEDPDVLSTQGLQALLNIGPIYQLKEGESIFSVAARFQTTTKSILNLNPDFQNVDMLKEGQDVCLIPCSM